MRPPREGGPLGTGSAQSTYQPVTLQISFQRGRVIHLTTDELSR